MLISVVQSATGIIVRMKILTQATAYPSGLTGLTSASTGLTIGVIADNEATTTSYTVAGSTIESITTLGTYAAPTATKIRFKEVDATFHPGVVELQIANARYAVANSKYIIISIAGSTTNLIQSDALIQLQTFDPYSITNPVGTATSVTGAVGSVTGAVGSVTGNVGGNVVGTVASVTGNVGGNVIGGVGGNVIGSVGSVVGNVGGVAGVTFPATVASPTNITAGVITTVTNLTNAPTVGDFTAVMKTSLNSATPASITGAVGSVTGNVGGNVVGSVNNVVVQTGFSLATTGLDTISITDITNDADARSTFPKMIRALFNRHFNQVTCTATAQVVFNDSTVATDTMTLSDNGTTILKGKSS